MPKKNFDIQIFNLDGSPTTRGGQPEIGDDGQVKKHPDGNIVLTPKKPLLMKTAIAEALAAESDGHDIAAKLRFGMLAFKVARGEGDQEYTGEEIGDMRRAVGKAWGPLLVAQIVPVLDA